MTESLDSFVRKTPKQQRSRDRLDLILDTTANLLTEVGAHDLSMARLAEASGLTPGSIYEYVHDVADAVAAVGARGLDRLGQSLGHAFVEPTSAEEAAAVLINGFRITVLHYRNEVGFHQAVTTMEADPRRGAYNADDSRLNAVTVTALVEPFVPPELRENLYVRSLLATHLSGEASRLLIHLPDDLVESAIIEYESMLLDMFRLPKPSGVSTPPPGEPADRSQPTSTSSD